MNNPRPTSLISLSDAAGLLLAADNILCLTHRRPDGDTLGSASALCAGMRALGKTAYMLKNGEITDKYRPYVADFFAPEGFAPGFVVACDTAASNLLPPEAAGLSARVDLSVDHHHQNSLFARSTLLNSEAASCGEIVYDLLLACGIKPDKRLSTLLYIAVSTDTGCFRYGNTTPSTLRTAADLLEAGVPAGEINRQLFGTRSLARFRLESEIISRLELHFGGLAAVSCITLEMLSLAGVGIDDIEDISDLPRQISGVEAGVTIRENKEGGCKVSVRTAQVVDASAVCAALGGGGHKRAAGCDLSCPLLEAKALLLREIEKALEDKLSFDGIK